MARPRSYLFCLVAPVHMDAHLALGKQYPHMLYQHLEYSYNVLVLGEGDQDIVNLRKLLKPPQPGGG